MNEERLEGLIVAEQHYEVTKTKLASFEEEIPGLDSHSPLYDKKPLGRG